MKKSSSTLYNKILLHFFDKEITPSALKKIFKGSYAENTYSSFLPKHCCPFHKINCKNARNGTYIIYFFLVRTGVYRIHDGDKRS